MVLTTQEQKTYDLIEVAGDDGILLHDLSVRIFGDRIGLHKTKIHQVRVVVCHIRGKIAASGIGIPFCHVSGRYRVVPLSVEVAA